MKDDIDTIGLYREIQEIHTILQMSQKYNEKEFSDIKEKIDRLNGGVRTNSAELSKHCGWIKTHDRIHEKHDQRVVGFGGVAGILAYIGTKMAELLR